MILLTAWNYFRTLANGHIGSLGRKENRIQFQLRSLLPCVSKMCMWCLYIFFVGHAPLFQILSKLSPTVAEEGRIINGSEMNPPQKYPFMVSILWNHNGIFMESSWFNGYVELPNGTTDCFSHPHHHCGASVLNKDWILSAAHCCYVIFDDKPRTQHLRVVTGLHDRDNPEPWSQNLSIADRVIHEGFQ